MKEDQEDLMTEARVKELLHILFPWGYSHPRENWYTGVSPYIGEDKNIITVVARDPEWGVLSICMERFNAETSEVDSLGFYKGIMKVIAPELYSDTEDFKGDLNVLEFHWSTDNEQDNRFGTIIRES